MDRDLKKIIWLSLVFLVFGGIKGFITLWDSIIKIFVAFFPFFMEVGKMALKDYLTSPYFIVGILMAIGSALGIWFGAKGGKILFMVVSVICEIVSLTSILVNVL